jgi:hypothetical protein
MRLGEIGRCAGYGTLVPDAGTNLFRYGGFGSTISALIPVRFRPVKEHPDKTQVLDSR